MNSFWVNYQKQGEFNPLDAHEGVYSFVIWMKIPTRFFEQNKNPIALKSNESLISAFQFHFLDILGQKDSFLYEMNPEMEGTMLFFPAQLQHVVYPFLIAMRIEFLFQVTFYLIPQNYYEGTTF